MGLGDVDCAAPVALLRVLAVSSSSSFDLFLFAAFSLSMLASDLGEY